MVSVIRIDSCERVVVDWKKESAIATLLHDDQTCDKASYFVVETAHPRADSRNAPTNRCVDSLI